MKEDDGTIKIMRIITQKEYVLYLGSTSNRYRGHYK